MISRKRTFIVTVILLTVVATSGCGTTPEGESTTVIYTNTLGPTAPLSDTPSSPTPSVTFDMVLIPAGEFEMGGDAEQSLSTCQILHEPYHQGECKLSEFEDEEPIHIVYLDEYYIDKYEVTNADYQICVEDEVCDPPKRFNSFTRDDYYGNPEFSDYPVIYVNWFDAQTFCEWRGSRLPTEAEWEKAARGTDGRIYPWGDSYNGNKGNFCDRDYEYDDGYEDTAPVGSFPEGASLFGVMDLAGNVGEWIEDWYGTRYYSESPFENPRGPIKGSMRVIRGGSYDCEGTYCVRAADRTGWFPEYKYDRQGFRCADSSP